MLLPHGWGHDLRVSVHQGVITAIEPCDTTATAVDVLAPGFVDLQVNGVDDVDVASARGADWDRLDALLLAQGVTMQKSTFASFFYLLVGAHGLHVLGGLTGVGLVVSRMVKGTATLPQLRAAQIFWTFVVTIWPIIYVMVYL